MDNMQNIRTALYIRVSTDEQAREGLSLGAQKSHLIDYAKRNGYKIAGIYSDEGVSARKPYKYRKQFMQLMSDVQDGKIDIILFIKLDRWFRSIADYYKIQEILEKCKVGWKATTENYDTTTANGRLHVNIRLSVAQDEADRTGERIKFVFDRKVERGEVISGSVPMGYRIQDRRLVIDPEKAEIIRQLYRNYLTMGNKQAAMHKVESELGCTLSYSSVLSYLKNPMYTGKYRGNPNYCPAIISQELFDKVQIMQAQNNTPAPNSPSLHCYIFAGLIRCPVCGEKMSGKKNGIYQNHRYCYYRCAHKDCYYSHYISEPKLEQYVLEHTPEEFLPSNFFDFYSTLSLESKKILWGKLLNCITPNPGGSFILEFNGLDEKVFENIFQKGIDKL